MVKAQRYESARVKRRGFESRTCRNHSPQANSQLSCPSSRRSVNEYLINFEETSRRPQAHISSCMVAKPLGVKWLKVEGHCSAVKTWVVFSVFGANLFSLIHFIIYLNSVSNLFTFSSVLFLRWYCYLESYTFSDSLSIRNTDNNIE